MLNEFNITISEVSYEFLAFMYSGGYVLWCIFFLNMLLWTLIIERKWYFQRVFPVMAEQTIKQWSQRKEQSSWYAQSIRSMMIARLQAKLTRHLMSIRSFVQLLPILGLLGTIIGMIETFEVLNLYGTGNVRALAGSISKALITTLAGLISAIPGLFVSSLLQQQAEQKIEQLSDKLPTEALVQG